MFQTFRNFPRWNLAVTQLMALLFAKASLTMKFPKRNAISLEYPLRVSAPE
jgi:hypothetical protein